MSKTAAVPSVLALSDDEAVCLFQCTTLGAHTDSQGNIDRIYTHRHSLLLRRPDDF